MMNEQDGGDTLQWKYCDTIARIEGSAIRVLERHKETGEYREKVYQDFDIDDSAEANYK